MGKLLDSIINEAAGDAEARSMAVNHRALALGQDLEQLLKKHGVPLKDFQKNEIFTTALSGIQYRSA